MRENRCDEHVGATVCCTKRCARPTGVVMVAPQTLLRNASMAQSKGNARSGVRNKGKAKSQSPIGGPVGAPTP